MEETPASQSALSKVGVGLAAPSSRPVSAIASRPARGLLVWGSSHVALRALNVQQPLPLLVDAWSGLGLGFGLRVGVGVRDRVR
eukprot:scaffold3193_cov42-Phaeocystis_antarctica.AAC.1